MKMLEMYSNELINGIKAGGKEASAYTHRYYWETRNQNVKKEEHPGIYDEVIPEEIRGINFNTWKEIAESLGYPR